MRSKSLTQQQKHSLAKLCATMNAHMPVCSNSLNQQQQQQRINTLLCPIKVNRKTIELIINTSCYCVFDLLCVIFAKLIICSYYLLIKCHAYFIPYRDMLFPKSRKNFSSNNASLWHKSDKNCPLR